jgi:sulfide:quinone oxidoreductase
VSEERHRVIVAGAGIAGLEALLALDALAAEHVEVTVLAPDPAFVMGAASVGTPFGHGPPPEHDVGAIATEHGARLVRDALHGVHLGDRCAVTRDGERLAFDALLVAVGARRVPAYPAALTFRDARDVDVIITTLHELEAGRVASLALVVPPGPSWPLPLYELALLTAAHAELHGLDVELSLVTPEPAPLAALGRDAAEHAAETLAAAGVAVLAATEVVDVRESGELVGPGHRSIAFPERTIALARLHGPGIHGIAHDEEGFIPVDDAGRVPGADGVYAAGDATAGPLKHGGIGAQQAERAAHEIARAAGAPVAPQSRRQVLRAELMEGPGRTFLRRPLDAGTAVLARDALWWPPLKVAAPRLSTYLSSHKVAT